MVMGRDRERQDVLADPRDQPQEWLEKHTGKRHPLIAFVTRGEHKADHRLHQDHLDHVHEK
jgi:hypothetical protein